MPFLKEVLDVQRDYPRAGRFRVRGLLEKRFEVQGRIGELPSERTIGRAMAKNRQFHDAPGPWVSDTPSDPRDKALKELPYQPTYRHQYWFIDIRYTTRVANQRTYSICILEGYSRKLLAGMASPYQDLIAILQLLAGAIGEYGCPAGIVSDNGAVFTAHAYQAVLAALEIEACYIEKGKPWQNLIEAAFKIETRLADPVFAEAQTLDELQATHVRFLATYNTTAHWAHKDRADELRTPEAVLGWVRGRMVEPDTLRQVLRQLQVERAVDRRGYVSIQRFAIYAERGLARQRVSIWLYEGRLHIEYQQTLLARYTYRYDRKHKRLRAVHTSQLYATAFASPQMELWELDDEQWRKVLERPVRLRGVRPLAMSPMEQLAFQLVG